MIEAALVLALSLPPEPWQQYVEIIEKSMKPCECVVEKQVEVVGEQA